MLANASCTQAPSDTVLVNKTKMRARQKCENLRRWAVSTRAICFAFSVFIILSLHAASETRNLPPMITDHCFSTAPHSSLQSGSSARPHCSLSTTRSNRRSRRELRDEDSTSPLGHHRLFAPGLNCTTQRSSLTGLSRRRIQFNLRAFCDCAETEKAARCGAAVDEMSC
jgi:hypothetical protein